LNKKFADKHSALSP
jgi:hypothetical protein